MKPWFNDDIDQALEQISQFQSPITYQHVVKKLEGPGKKEDKI